MNAILKEPCKCRGNYWDVAGYVMTADDCKTEYICAMCGVSVTK